MSSTNGKKEKRTSALLKRHNSHATSGLLEKVTAQGGKKKKSKLGTLEAKQNSIFKQKVSSYLSDCSNAPDVLASTTIKVSAFKEVKKEMELEENVRG